VRPPPEILDRLRGRYGASGIAAPAREGFAAQGGVRLAYQVHGTARAMLLLLPGWQIAHCRTWKFQVPYLARSFQVVTYDARGSGRSDRPETGYDHDTLARDALAVLDAAGADRAALVAWSGGTNHAIMLAAEHPARVRRLVLLSGAPSQARGPERERRRQEVVRLFHQARAQYTGWAKLNAHYFRQDYAGWVEFFAQQMLPEPHSLRGIADAIAWGLDGDPEILIRTRDEWWSRSPFPDLMARIEAPTLLIHGTEDRLAPYAANAPFMARTIPHATLVTLEGCGHAPHLRDPVRVNRLVRDFVAGPAGGPAVPRRRAHAATARPRLLWVCSPIGLGHVQRDLAIVRELRRLRPGLEVQWLSAEPVRSAVQQAGELVHPASDRLCNESAHIEARAAAHDVNVFLALWEMDEVLTANFMTFADVVSEERYDAWVGDEAWDVDHFLYENPDLKTAPYVFLTDFIGMLPVAGWDSFEGRCCWHANAEHVAHVRRAPRLRDAAIFLGAPEDVLDQPFGPGLPNMREWTGAHFEFCDYPLAFDPATLPPPAALRRELRYGEGETLVIATAGGTGVGRHLLEKTLRAAPALARAVPRLRLVVVAGPRTALDGLPRDGAEVRGYLPDLYRHLACCDAAIVHGGLTTGMELVALGRPFLSFPLRNHFEQRFHVARRLHRYGHRGQLDYDETTPEGLADAIRRAIEAPVAYAPLVAGGAARAAGMVARVLGE
jgi:pimeloyl-ACP methyl ester carboxylesterase/UDP:flavonoid glycosyltransferase YjiC (YdhE family)